jgi:hypothetical protein
MTVEGQIDEDLAFLLAHDRGGLSGRVLFFFLWSFV